MALGHDDWVRSALGVDPVEYAGNANVAEAPPRAPRTGGILDTLSDLAQGAAEAVSEAASTVQTTVSEAATTVETAVGEAVDAVGKTVGEAYEAAKTFITGEAPLPPDVPAARADEKLKALSEDDRKKVQALLDGAKSEQKKQYLTKGLAAGHTPAELEAFAKKINGKDEKWLNDNLRLVGDSKGKGIKQQWSYSCGPTTVEAIKGELDPLYALKVREENPDFEEADNADGKKKNPKIAEDQRVMLEDEGGGVATSRDDPEQKGQGLVFEDLLNKQMGGAGLAYHAKEIGGDVTMDEALNTMQDEVGKGVPVPITVGDAKSPYAHAALVTAVEKGPPRKFTIHDPWEGRTDTFTEDQIKNDQVNVGGWKHVGVVFPAAIKK